MIDTGDLIDLLSPEGSRVERLAAASYVINSGVRVSGCIRNKLSPLRRLGPTRDNRRPRPSNSGENSPGFQMRLEPERPYSRPMPDCLKPPKGASGACGAPVDDHAPGFQLLGDLAHVRGIALATQWR